MEFGIAAVGAAIGAVFNVALSKLRLVKEKKVKTDVILISNKLGLIRAAMHDYAGRGGHLSFVQTELISQLRRFAYDIEDCIDCFDAKKTTLAEFAIQILELKVRSEDMRSEIISLKAQQSIMGAPEQEVALVPSAIQDLLGWRNCLLYLCLFPPEHHVRTKPLIRRWLAEGLVQGENFGVQNLGLFVDDSRIINSISIERSNNGKVKRCQPTDVMLQNITQWSSSEGFILVCDGTAQLAVEAARRISVHPSADGELILPEDLSCLRTLAVFRAGATSLERYEAVLDFTRYGMLRVLDLKECDHLSEEHLRDIWGQVLMKYLSINMGSIDSIAREIRCLKQLETLDLTGSDIVTVFKEVLLLPKLKHLFGKVQLSKKDNTILGWALKKFLRDKSVLETLAGFVTGERLGFPQLMSRMRRLRKVKIWCQSNASQSNLDAISRAITKFIREGTNEPDLSRSLSIDFERCSREFVNSIHTDAGDILASLNLRGHLSRFPQFVAHLSSVVELCLWSTSLRWKEIREGLIRVKGLKYLKLIEDNLQSLNIFSQDDHLKALERISVVCEQKLEVAITVTQLVSLHILCQDLHVIPRTSGIDIKRMKKLEEVVLHADVNRTIRKKVRHAALRHGKRLIAESLVLQT